MARHKLSAMFSDLRGKLNGSKFSKGRSSHTLTNKVKGSNPRSLTQTNVRSAFRKFSSMWQTLTAAQIVAWNSLAQDSSKRNAFGDSYKTTGHKLFVSSNVNAKLMNKAQIIDGIAPKVPTLGLIENISAAEGTGIVKFDTTEALDANTVLEIRVTRQLSPGKTNINGQFRTLKLMPAPLPASTYNVTADYAAKFGAPVEGRLIGFEFRTCSDNGAAMYRNPQEAKTVVVAA